MKRALIGLVALVGVGSNLLVGTSSNLVSIDNKSGKVVEIVYEKFLKDRRIVSDCKRVVVQPGENKNLSDPIKISGPEWEHTWKKDAIPKELKEMMNFLDTSEYVYKEYTQLTCGDTVFDLRDHGSGEIQWRVGEEISSFQKEKKKKWFKEYYPKDVILTIHPYCRLQFRTR